MVGTSPTPGQEESLTPITPLSPLGDPSTSPPSQGGFEEIHTASMEEIDDKFIIGWDDDEDMSMGLG